MIYRISYFVAIRPDGSAAVAWGVTAYGALRAARTQHADVQIPKTAWRWRWPAALIVRLSNKMGDGTVYKVLESRYGFVSDDDLALDTEILQRKGLL